MKLASGANASSLPHGRHATGYSWSTTVPASQSTSNSPMLLSRISSPLTRYGSGSAHKSSSSEQVDVCVSDDGSMDKSCEAVFNYYSFHDRYYANDHELLVASSLFWEDFDFWCTDDVLDAIDAGDFRERLQAGEYGAWKRHVQH